MTVHIVTDSTCDLLPSEAGTLGVAVVPLTVHFGDEQLRDGVDIDAATFYRRLGAGRVHPTTSQPSPQRFAEVYQRLLQRDADEVVSIHISSKWSGTLQSAALAAQDLGGRVHVVDSLTVSAGMQLLVRAAVRDVAAGADAATVVAATEERRGRVRVFVLLDTLTYLQRGGRIGRAQALVGGVLNVKPLLRIVDGEAHPQARVRSRQVGVTRLCELLAAEGPLEAVATMVGGTSEGAVEIGERLRRAYPDLELVAGSLGPVVGVYAGPGALGVAGLRAGS